MTARGIGLVARQEIRTRLRTGRWKILLAAWFLVVNGLGLLFRVALEYGDTSTYGEPGVPMFGGVLLGVLVLTLQVTRLTPGEIALGKLAAIWGTGLVALLLTLPSLLLPVAEGAIGAGRAFVVLLVTALMIGVVCAVSQAWSAVLARSVTSILLSYLTVFGLLVGTPLLFTLAVPLTSEHVPGPYGGYDREHTERIWWLLAPNPVVALADAAPRLPERRIVVGDLVMTRSASSDPLGQISRGVRGVRAGDDDHGPERRDGAAVWPWGLAFDLALAGGAVAITASRLRTPLHRVPRGVRVA